MTYVMIMVDDKGACSEVPASWQIIPGVESFESVDVRPDEIAYYPGQIPTLSRWRRYWKLAGQIAGISRLKTAPVDSRRTSLRALVFPGDKRLLARATDDLLDRIAVHDAAMIYEEQ